METLDKWLSTRTCLACIYHKVSYDMLNEQAINDGYYYDECTKYVPYEHIILDVDEAEACQYYEVR